MKIGTLSAHFYFLNATQMSDFESLSSTLGGSRNSEEFGTTVPIQQPLGTKVWLTTMELKSNRR